MHNPSKFSLRGPPQVLPRTGGYYERMKKKGKKHAAILRALAFKWIRILWKCWQDRKPYDQAAYLKQLSHRKSPNAVATT
jgi:hypothetical protein